jgi:starvation-inducible DNA-binding protein
MKEMTIRKIKYKDLDDFFLKESQPIKVNTNIGLTDNQKNKIYAVLKTLYADTFILMVKTLDYHWNIKGKLLGYMRELTIVQYQDLFASLSAIAERMNTLGFKVPTSLHQIMNGTTLEEKSIKISPIALIADLIKDNENISKFIRDELTAVYGAKDETSLTVLRNRLEVHEKNAWELRSLIEK